MKSLKFIFCHLAKEQPKNIATSGSALKEVFLWIELVDSDNCKKKRTFTSFMLVKILF